MMDAETQAAIGALKSEIASLRAEIAAAGAGEMAGGEGADVGLPINPLGGADYGAFRWEDGKITHCNFYAAHAVVELADVTVGQGQADGTWYLNVPHEAPHRATVSKTAGENDDDHTAVKLFTIENGEVKKDYRGMPFIPIYA